MSADLTAALATLAAALRCDPAELDTRDPAAIDTQVIADLTELERIERGTTDADVRGSARRRYRSLDAAWSWVRFEIARELRRAA